MTLRRQVNAERPPRKGVSKMHDGKPCKGKRKKGKKKAAPKKRAAKRN